MGSVAARGDGDDGDGGLDDNANGDLNPTDARLLSNTTRSMQMPTTTTLERHVAKRECQL